MRGIGSYFKLFTLGAITILITGCAGGGFSLGYYDHQSDERANVYVEPEPVHVLYVHVDHVCNEHCYNHYYDGSRVVVLEGHHHGPHCGHRWDGRHWVISENASYRRSNDALRNAPHPRKYKTKSPHKSKQLKKSKGHH